MISEETIEVPNYKGGSDNKWLDMERRVMKFLSGYHIIATTLEEIEYKALMKSRLNLFKLKSIESKHKSSMATTPASTTESSDVNLSQVHMTKAMSLPQ